MHDNQRNPQEIVQKMVEFMNSTNEQLKILHTRVNNMQIDIDNLKKHLKKTNNKNRNLIIGR